MKATLVDEVHVSRRGSSPLDPVLGVASHYLLATEAPWLN